MDAMQMQMMQNGFAIQQQQMDTLRRLHEAPMALQPAQPLPQPQGGFGVYQPQQREQSVICFRDAYGRITQCVKG